jgi:hypothetical protein
MGWFSKPIDQSAVFGVGAAFLGHRAFEVSVAASIVSSWASEFWMEPFSMIPRCPG